MTNKLSLNTAKMPAIVRQAMVVTRNCILPYLFSLVLWHLKGATQCPHMSDTWTLLLHVHQQVSDEFDSISSANSDDTYSGSGKSFLAHTRLGGVVRHMPIYTACPCASSCSRADGDPTVSENTRTACCMWAIRQVPGNGYAGSNAACSTCNMRCRRHHFMLPHCSFSLQTTIE